MVLLDSVSRERIAGRIGAWLAFGYLGIGVCGSYDRFFSGVSRETAFAGVSTFSKGQYGGWILPVSGDCF